MGNSCGNVKGATGEQADQETDIAVTWDSHKTMEEVDVNLLTVMQERLCEKEEDVSEEVKHLKPYIWKLSRHYIPAVHDSHVSPESRLSKGIFPDLQCRYLNLTPPYG